MIYFFLEPQSNILPHLVHYTSKIIGIEGQTVELGCAFQGFPSPTYRLVVSQSSTDFDFAFFL